MVLANVAVWWLAVVATVTAASVREYTVRSGASTNGLLDSKIIGGTRGSLAHAGATVQIELLQNGGWFYTCAGLAVNANHVVTAAHCAADPTTKRAFSSGTLRIRVASARSEAGGRVVGVRGVQLHPKWTTSQPTASIEYGSFDVAVLTLATSLGATVRAAKLAAVGQHLPAETVVSVSSWGVTKIDDSLPASVLRTATFRVVPQVTCDQLYRKRGARVAPSQFCIRSATTKALCSGDSGAPVTRVSDGAVVGLYSWGSCGVDSNPGVITDLSNKEVRSFVNSAGRK